MRLYGILLCWIYSDSVYTSHGADSALLSQSRPSGGNKQKMDSSMKVPFLARHLFERSVQLIVFLARVIRSVGRRCRYKVYCFFLPVKSPCGRFLKLYLMIFGSMCGLKNRDYSAIDAVPFSVTKDTALSEIISDSNVCLGKRLVGLY